MKSILFNKTLDFIHSNTMKEYLYKMYQEGEFTPSAEDLFSIAYNSDNSLQEKNDFILELREYIEDKKSVDIVLHSFSLLLSDFKENGLYLLYVDRQYDDFYTTSTNEIVFPSVKDALSYLNLNQKYFINCKLCQNGKTLIENVYIEQNGVSGICTTHHEERDDISMPYISDNTEKLLNKYVYIPNPFSPGDVVYTYSKPSDLYVVINAEATPPSEDLDYYDTSVMVIPYEFKEYATPEKIEEHYNRLKEAKSQQIFINPYDIDIISLEHEHFYTLYLELKK